MNKALSYSNKIFKLLGFLFIFPILLLFIFLIRAMAPIYLVRLKELYSHRFGHFCIEPEIYLARQSLAVNKRRGIDLFCLDALPVSNRHLARMWSREMHFLSVIRPLIRVNRMFPGWQKHEVPWDDIFGQSDELKKTEPFLKFTEAESIYGERKLRDILGSRNGPIVCVFNRDSTYLSQHAPYRSWDYHDYRDSDIETYIPAMEWLAEQGYVVFRMGAIVNKPLPDNLHPNIIDYATLHRSEFLDIYIPFKCSFLLVATSGPSTLGNVFRRPQAYINAAPFLTTTIPKANPNELVIPKLYFSDRTQKHLSIEEIIELGAEKFDKGEQFQALGIRLVDNDEADILTVAQEIEGLVSGTQSTSGPELILQKKFWQCAGMNVEETKNFPQPSPG